jgi:3-hydroxybutyryl-CoA dehydrogenase
LLIITGAGTDFAAGADIGELRARTRDDALAGINRTVFDRIAALPMPTIAAVEGNALGGGAELAYAGDISIASSTARFGNPEAGLGILAAAGASYRLADLVGKSVAKIAQVFATAGASVTIAEASDDAAHAAHRRVALGLQRAAEKQSLPCQPESVLARVHTVGGLTELPPDAALVVEAVPERISDKITVLTAAEKVVGPAAILAGNTGSLSIKELAAPLAHPVRFLGIHFFNPVPASELVELVWGPETDPSIVRTALNCVRALGKSDVVVRDSPGFAISRLGVALGLEGIRMLEEGVADAESIDRAMELGYRHPMGPLRSTDLVGLDVRLAIATTLGDRFRPPQLLRDKVARGELGRKTCQGFYRWPD